MAEPVRTSPWWLKVLVLFHGFMVLSWSLPDPAQAVKIGIAKPSGLEVLLQANYTLKGMPINRYLTYTGLWQSWDMFAPNPSNADIWCDAEVEYRSGRKLHYAYPRMFDLSIPRKYVSERYRKFFERVNQDSNSFVWPAFAQRIAMKCDIYPDDPPIIVWLTRHWKHIPPPGNPLPLGYNSYMFFEYAVDQVALGREP